MAGSEEKPKARRVRLKRHFSDVTVVPEEEIQVIASGGGDNTGEILVGTIIGVNSRVISVQFRDDEGLYVEKYLRKSGLRISDIGDDEGYWRIDVKDATRFLYPINVEEIAPPEVKLLSSEAIPYVGDPRDSMYVEVWEDVTKNIHYLRAFRTGPVGDGQLKRPKDLPCVVPFSILKQVLYDFESDQDDSKEDS